MICRRTWRQLWPYQGGNCLAWTRGLERMRIDGKGLTRDFPRTRCGAVFALLLRQSAFNVLGAIQQKRPFYAFHKFFLHPAGFLLFHCFAFLLQGLLDCFRGCLGRLIISKL